MSGTVFDPAEGRIGRVRAHYAVRFMEKPPTSKDATAGRDVAPVTLAAPAFVIELVLPFVSLDPGVTLRSVTLVPGDWHPADVHQTSQPPFDAVITVGEEANVPGEWEHLLVGEIAYALFASQRIARSLEHERPKADDVEDLPYVALVSASDLCPVPRADRWVTHEVETFALACRVAAALDRLVYAPVLVAAPFVRDGSTSRSGKATLARGWRRSSRGRFASRSASRSQ
jgi:hypothetical protein